MTTDETNNGNGHQNPALSAALRAGAGLANSPSDAFGVAKVAGKSLWRTVGAVTKGSIDAASELAHDIGSGAPVSQVIDNRLEQARHAAAQIVGADDDAVARGLRGTPDDMDEQRAAGDLLIYLSWNPDNQPRDRHPAFKQILQSITPDEARILRFLAVAGSQPSLDLRTKTPFQVGSQRLAAGINMVAQMAGCVWPDLDHAYLANLNRLGLLRFSEEPVKDFRRYSVLTAQPPAMAVFHKTKKIQPVYRSIYLSEWGQLFCRASFTLDGYNAGGWADSSVDDVIKGKGPPWLRASKKKGH